MNTKLFQGQLVRLAAADVEKDAETWAKWSRDSEYLRLLDSDPAIPRSIQDVKKSFEDHGPNDRSFPFAMRTLDEDRLIGFIGLGIYPSLTQGNGWVGIGIGERDCWGRGYGTDAMKVLLRYAFTEINLHRVSLGVFDYNARAIKSYEKAGFVLEGRMREAMHRDRKYWDILFMGVLRDEWMKKNS